MLSLPLATGDEEEVLAGLLAPSGEASEVLVVSLCSRASGDVEDDGLDGAAAAPPKKKKKNKAVRRRLPARAGQPIQPN